jgi:hypothetical protein
MEGELKPSACRPGVLTGRTPPLICGRPESVEKWQLPEIRAISSNFDQYFFNNEVLWKTIDSLSPADERLRELKKANKIQMRLGLLRIHNACALSAILNLRSE